MRNRTFGAFGILFALTAGTVQAQAVVETYTGWNGSDYYVPLGVDPIGTDAYGQIFTAPAQYLNSWSFWLANYENGSDLMFTGNIATWTGSAVGTVLWTSASVGGNGSETFQQYLFNTGGVSLNTAGEEYIFFLDAVSGSGTNRIGAQYADVYPSGYFAYHNDPDHTQAWDGHVTQSDLVFIAEFDRVPGGPGSTVPEPATMTLLATGLAGMAAARRRKRNV